MTLKISHVEKFSYSEDATVQRNVSVLQDNELVGVLAEIISQSSDSIILTDIEGNIQYVNSAFERMTGYLQEELIGKNTNIINSGMHTESFFSQMWATLKSGTSWQGRMYNRRKDGTIYLEGTTISPLKSPDGTIVGYFSIKRDITREIELEQQLSQVQKMDVLGKFASGIAHDFNNTLHAVTAYVYFMENDLLPEKHPVLKQLLEMKNVLERATSLTEKLLSFGQRQALQFVTINLGELLRQSVDMLKRIIGESITINLLTRNTEKILGDPGSIEQSLINLCLNAKDAMPSGGQITIKTEIVCFDHHFVKSNQWANEGSFAMISVSDHGIGMNKQTLEKAFEPLFSTKTNETNSGLGLSMVYGTVKQHDGFLNVQSAPNEGTTVSMYFPLAAEEVVTTAEKKQTLAMPTSPKAVETILVAEDDNCICNLVSRIFRTAGYIVIKANDGQEAVEQYKAHMEQISLIFIDIMMPKKNGPTVYEEIRQLGSTPPVLFTSSRRNHSIDKIMSINELPFIHKPYSPADLLKMVRTLLDDC